MGYFTWTLANREEKLRKDGHDYLASCKLGYDCLAVVVCPDNTKIIEPSYFGYGIFGGKDIYELVVDWNRPYLDQIFSRLDDKHPDGYWGQQLKQVAIAYKNQDESALQDEIKRLSENFGMWEEWKREIGIAISCDDEHNAMLPYPIKIVNTLRTKPYDELHPSSCCQ